MSLDRRKLNSCFVGAAAVGLLLSSSFSFSAPENRAVVLLDRTPVYSVSVFSDLGKNCVFEERTAREAMARFLRPDSALLRELDLLIPGAFHKLKSANLHILIDDTKKRDSRHSAYFLGDYPKKNENAIILGCDLVSQSYWEKSLAHELVHLFLKQHKVPIWLNEGLAQLIEYNLGGIQPELRLKKFQDSALSPGLVDETGLFKDKNSYALSYLFVSYLFDNFGGWNLFIHILENADDRCRSEIYWENFACLGQSYLAKKGKLALEKRFTEKGLLRFFFIALSLNHPRHSYYHVSKWDGFSGSLTEAVPGLLKLGPAQSIRLSSESFLKRKLGRKPDDLEIYRIVADDLRFQIFPLAQSKDALLVFKSDRITKDFFVVMNVSAARAAELVFSN